MVGKVFIDIDGSRNYIVNIFSDWGSDIVTFKQWMEHRQEWKYVTLPIELRLLEFNHWVKWV